MNLLLLLLGMKKVSSLPVVVAPASCGAGGLCLSGLILESVIVSWTAPTQEYVKVWLGQGEMGGKPSEEHSL